MTLIYFGDFPARHEGLDVDFHCNWVMGCPWSHLESRSIPMATLPRPHTPTLVDVPSSSGNWSTPPVLAVWQWKQLGAPRSGSPVLESRDGTGSRSLMLMDTDGPQDLHRIGWFGQEGKEGDRQTDRRDTDRLMYVHTYPSSYLDRWTNR
jgi:hypothetical protein